MKTYFVKIYGQNVKGNMRSEVSTWSNEENAKWCIHHYQTIMQLNQTTLIDHEECKIVGVYAFEGKILPW